MASRPEELIVMFEELANRLNIKLVQDKGDFSGSVSGGCVETAVVRECLGLFKDKKAHKKIEFKVSNESAWEIGLACGGEIAIFLEQIN